MDLFPLRGLFLPLKINISPSTVVRGPNCSGRTLLLTVIKSDSTREGLKSEFGISTSALSCS